MSSKRKKQIIAGVLIFLGFIAGFVAFIGTAFVMCGISGCSGGGFGIAVNPLGTIIGLMITGAFTAGGVLAASAILHSKRLLVAGVILLITTPFIAGYVIGANWNGYPRSICKYGNAEEGTYYGTCR